MVKEEVVGDGRNTDEEVDGKRRRNSSCSSGSGSIGSSTGDGTDTDTDDEEEQEHYTTRRARIIRNHHNKVEAAVEIVLDPDTPGRTRDVLLTCRDVALAALESCKESVRNSLLVPEEIVENFPNDKEVIAAAVEKVGEAILYADYEMLLDRELVLLALQNHVEESSAGGDDDEDILTLPEAAVENFRLTLSSPLMQ